MTRREGVVWCAVLLGGREEIFDAVAPLTVVVVDDDDDECAPPPLTRRTLLSSAPSTPICVDAMLGGTDEPCEGRLLSVLVDCDSKERRCPAKRLRDALKDDWGCWAGTFTGSTLGGCGGW